MDKFNYMMLSRLQMDCNSYLGNSNSGGNAKHLWAQSVEAQITEMKRLWNLFSEDEKPQWITLEEINQFEVDMLAREKMIVTCVGKPQFHIKFVTEKTILVTDLENSKNQIELTFTKNNDYQEIILGDKKRYVIFDDTEDFLTVAICRDESYISEVCCSLER